MPATLGVHGGQVFIAMEFVRGLTLEQWQGSIDRRSSAGIEQIVAMYVQAGKIERGDHGPGAGCGEAGDAQSTTSRLREVDPDPPIRLGPA